MIAQHIPDGTELSRREHEVVTLVVEGCSDSEIALRLGISPRTAQAHVSAALKKTGTNTRLQLAVHALREGIVPLHPRYQRQEP